MQLELLCRQVIAFTFAVHNVKMNKERGNDAHGSKVIAVPFDGVSLDRDLTNAPAARQPASP